MNIDQRSGPIIAVTAEDDRFRHAREAGARLARRRQAPLILYDVDSASLFNEPMPSGWSAEGAGEQLGSRLTGPQLERLGRRPIAQQLEEAARSGVETFGWLPTSHGPDPLAEYALEQSAQAVVVPAEQEDCDAFCAVLAGTFKPVEKLAETTPIEVVVVGEDGSEDIR
jgi:hypothetical protein